MRSRGPDLATRARALGSAVDVAAGRLEGPALEQASTIRTRAAERSGLSAEHTVVALAGGTGAGKSSLTNVLAGAQIARTSTQRPTTAHPLAAVAESAGLAAGSGALLDWLGVPTRHDLPVGPHHPDGLILLDLPDQDSVVTDHRLRADHVIARADVLIWVTNPQKYADAVLHSEYLRPLSARSGEVVVVLNQIDRLSPEDAKACVADLERLVAADGLTATVLATSVVTGQGIEELRGLITRAVSRREAATARLVAEVRQAATGLLDLLPEAAKARTGPAREELLAALSEAAGAHQVVAAVQGSSVRDAAALTGWPPTRWLQRFRGDPLRTLGLRAPGGRREQQEPSAGAEAGVAASEPVLRRSSLPQASPASRARTATAARGYVAAATAALPGAWGEQLNARVVADVAGAADALDVAVVRTVDTLTLRPARWWRVVSSLQWFLLLVMIAGLGWLAVLAVLGYLQLPTLLAPVVTLGALEVPWPTLLAVAGGALGIATAALSRLAARVGARRRAGAARARLRSAVEQVASEHLLGAVEEELAALATIRQALATAASP